jgi:hypothetical protein
LVGPHFAMRRRIEISWARQPTHKMIRIRNSNHLYRQRETPPVKVEPPAVKVEQDDDNVYDVQREFVVKTEQETERAEQLEEFYSADPGPSDYRRRYTRGGSEF